MEQFVYGVDFGTTNSAISIFDLHNNVIVQTFTESSLLYFPKTLKEEHCYFVGKDAIDQYLANKMEGRFMKSIKGVLPSAAFTHTNIYGVTYKAEELIALILTKLKAKADSFLGKEVAFAVFGRPVVFSEDKHRDQLAQDRLQKAAKIAGFQKVFFQFEPIAAAFTYERNIKKTEKVLVGDFGGGTSDFTLMELNPQNTNEQNRRAAMLAKDGIYIGGDNFDAEIMWHKLVPYFGYGLQYQSQNKMLDLPVHYFRNICSWRAMNFFKTKKIKTDLDFYYYATKENPAIQRLIYLVTKNLGYSLFRAIEKAKILLSKQEMAAIVFEEKSLAIDIQKEIHLEEFNQMIQKDVVKIEKHLMNFLRKNRVRKSEIDSVFITGGSSLVKAVQTIFTSKFGAEKVHSGDTFNSVVNGLAFSAPLFLEGE